VVAVRTRRGVVAGILAAFALALPAAAAGAEPAKEKVRCATEDVGGGDWPSYGHDDRNSRFQPHEKVISPGDAPLLTPAWTFSVAEAGGQGDIAGTPVIDGGCAYVATSNGWVFALNADTGETVWKRQAPGEGNAYGSVGVTAKRVYVGLNRTSASLTGCPQEEKCLGPYMIALDRKTGKRVWASRPLDHQRGSDLYASPVFYEGVLMIGVSGGIAELSPGEEDRNNFQGSMNFLDARTGRILKKTWTIHAPGKPDDEYAGGGIWATPAIDRRAGVAYVGTSNPYIPSAAHPRAGAVLKLAIDRDRRNFGKILAFGEGTPEEYLEAFSDTPCIDFPGNVPPYPTGLGECTDLDLDFGASPNLFRGPDGRKLVGAGQKSGVYHVFDAQTMEPVWSTAVGPPSYVGGIVGSTAYDGESVYGPITVPGYAWSLSGDDGAYRWIAPIGDGLHWGPPVAVANGVVYSVDFTGFLNAFDARTGLVLAKRPLALGGTNTLPSSSWGGVSIARHTIYAAVGTSGGGDGFVVAFQPGGVNDLDDDLGETIDGLGEGGDGGGGGGSSGGSDLPIVAGPLAATTGYATPTATAPVGGPLDFSNLDNVQHDVSSVETTPAGDPLFRTPLIGLGETVPVEGLDRVESGRSYEFFCTLHPGMRGNLVVR
jgi:polyvinyl alcohol dehydrogenase (cytochrome)